MAIKLDLGAGPISPAGFTPLGNVNGTSVFPLEYEDSSVDEIRASHVLEHFDRALVKDVLAEWVRVLKPGGKLRVAVPDFRTIAANYLAGSEQPTAGYVMGGQTDGADYHKSIFDKQSLTMRLAEAGLMMIGEWESELRTDCAALPVSLNLAGVKPHEPDVLAVAVMSVPRLGFMDNFLCAMDVFPGLRIQLHTFTGAFWGQCLERVIEKTLRDDRPDVIITSDYDSIYTQADVAAMLQIMCCHPEVDALAAIQSQRRVEMPMFSVSVPGGRAVIRPEIHAEQIMTQVSTAHFGLTMFRASKFSSVTKPWFIPVPDPTGGWNDGREDEDINFWRKWEAAGNSLYVANRVAIGHLELTVRWPSTDGMKATTQNVNEWKDNGRPSNVWR